jgi:hypothetical protein
MLVLFQQMPNGSHMLMGMQPQQIMQQQGMMTQEMMQGHASGMAMMSNGMVAYPMVHGQHQQPGMHAGRGDSSPERSPNSVASRGVVENTSASQLTRIFGFHR